MVDGMAALTSAIMLQDIEPAEERVALTLMTSMINSPIAYAVPIVRVQREREDGESRSPITGSRRRQRVGPRLVLVPDLRTQKQDEAVVLLEELQLKPVVDLHESRAEDQGQVVDQKPAGGTTLIVGSRVTLSVGDGPAPPPEETLSEALRGLRDEVAELREELHRYRQASDVRVASSPP